MSNQLSASEILAKTVPAINEIIRNKQTDKNLNLLLYEFSNKQLFWDYKWRVQFYLFLYGDKL